MRDLSRDGSAAAPTIERSGTVRLVTTLLAIAAGVNVAVGVALALRDPRRASDLWLMVDWCRGWLINGDSLYTIADATTDYPPNAIAMLSPLALAPHGWVVLCWTIVAVALTPVLPWIVVRAASSDDRPWPARLLPVLFFLCWAAPRTLLQFSLLSMTLAWVAVLIADSESLASGATLGLALFKPHIAGPVALWMLVTGRVRPLLMASAVVFFGVAVYDVRIGESPMTTAIGWFQVLGAEYSGPDGLVGNTSLRAWAQEVTASPALADATWIAGSVALLVVLCGVAMRGRSRRLDQGGLAIPAMFCLWSLLAFYHNGNNMILILPAFAFLWFRDDAPGGARRWIPMLLLQAVLMFDVPVRLAGRGGFMVEQFDRIVVLATLAWVVFTWRRLAEMRSR